MSGLDNMITGDVDERHLPPPEGSLWARAIEPRPLLNLPVDARHFIPSTRHSAGQAVVRFSDEQLQQWNREREEFLRTPYLVLKARKEAEQREREKAFLPSEEETEKFMAEAASRWARVQAGEDFDSVYGE